MSDIFDKRHWEQGLELLTSLCGDNENILLVSGPSGVGKTTMKNKLIKTQANYFVCCDISSTESLTAEDITTAIEQDLDTSIDKNLLLLIDDAQNLSLDIIAVLLQLKRRASIGEKLQIVLFATQDLVQKVSRSILKEDFATQVHAIQIEPKKDAWHGLSPFAVGVTIFFGVSFCILAVLWPKNDGIDSTVLAKAEQMQPQPLPEPIADIQMSEMQDTAATSTPELMSTGNMVAEPAVAEPIAEIADSIYATSNAEPNSANNYEEKIASLEDKLKVLQQNLLTAQHVNQELELKIQKLSSKKKIESKNNTRKIGLKNNHQNKKKILGLSKGEKQILALPGKNYTLQLLCLNDERKVQNFIKNNKLQDTTRYYRSYFKGKHWYIVTYGNFANKDSANTALKNLPASLRKLRPWPREIANIHYSIGTRNTNE